MLVILAPKCAFAETWLRRLNWLSDVECHFHDEAPSGKPADTSIVYGEHPLVYDDRTTVGASRALPMIIIRCNHAIWRALREGIITTKKILQFLMEKTAHHLRWKQTYMERGIVAWKWICQHRILGVNNIKSRDTGMTYLSLRPSLVSTHL